MTSMWYLHKVGTKMASKEGLRFQMLITFSQGSTNRWAMHPSKFVHTSDSIAQKSQQNNAKSFRRPKEWHVIFRL